MQKVKSILIDITLTIISAFFYSMAFPSFISDKGYPFLAFIALIPLLIAIYKTSLKFSFLVGFLFGFIFLAIFNYWLSTFHNLAIFIGPSIRAIQFMFFVPIFKLIYTVEKKHTVLIQAISYTLYTYIIQQGFLGYPYGNLSSAFASYLPIVQITSITGQWFLSFFFIIPQIFIADYIVRYSKKNSFFKFLDIKKKFIILYFIILISINIFGYYRINYYKNITPSYYKKIAALQHNNDTWKGGYQQYKKNFETLKKMTMEAMEYNPDMILWSETAFVPSVSWHTKYPNNLAISKLVDDFVEFGKSLDVPLITGNPEGVLKENYDEPFNDDGSWNRDDYNSIILFNNDKIVDTYRKQHLVPFTEYFPYEKQFPKIYNFLKANDFKWWLPGDKSKIFIFNDLYFSTSICFEDVFEDISREFVKQGSSLLLNLTNDSWSGAVSAEVQHLNLGIFRSIENGRSTVRSTNSGITCLILPTGEVLKPLPPFTESYMIYDVPIFEKKDFGLTFYTKYGNWFVYLSFTLFIIWGIIKIRKLKKTLDN